MKDNCYCKTYNTNFRTKKIGSLLLILFSTSILMAQQENDERIMLQGFYWESAANNPNNWYNIVNSLSGEISEMKIDMIWLPPPSNAGSLEGYLPRELNNFSNNYGTLQAHKNLLNSLNSKGIEPIADIVINHRVGSTNFVDFTNPNWGTDAIASNDEVWNLPEYNNLYPRGNYDTGTPYEAARDIDHTKTEIQNSIIEFLNNLKDIGYKGWRYDFVHGFDTMYFKLYNEATQPTFSVGENFNANKQVIQNWIDNTRSSAFDFPTYFTLKSVIRDQNYSYLANSGEPSGGIGWDSRNYSTFIENHDTPRYDTPNNVLNANNVSQAYAYLLTHPGVPCIYWPHLFDWGENVKTNIKNLINIRKDAGIHSQSNTTIQRAQNNLYASITNGNNYDVAMKMGPNNWSPSGSNWTLVASGNNYALWTNKSETDETDSDENNTENFTVYTQDYSDIYSWDENINPTNGNWPGTPLVSEGNGWYSATVTGNCSNLIFSNNGLEQTIDLYSCANKPYFYENSWHAFPPDGNSGGFEIFVENFTHAYTWNDNLEPTSGFWPGMPLIESNSSYKKIKINEDCTHIIFSYNGNQQTADLNTCFNKPYFYNDNWHSKPEKNFKTTNFYYNSKNNKVFVNLNIEASSRAVNIKIMSLNGQLIHNYSKSLNHGKHQISFNREDLKLNDGLYFMKIEIDGKVTTKKIAINKL